MKLSSSESLRRVLRHISLYRWLVLALLFAAGAVAAALYVPILIGDAIDAIVGPGQVDFHGDRVAGWGSRCSRCWAPTALQWGSCGQ
ncbi:MAG: hypothetical protein V8T01_10530 [Oscillospiraceae bacterium]